MTRNILPVILLILVSALAKAQTDPKIALGASFDVVVPSENSTGPGFTLRAELPVSARIKFTFSAGFFTNFGKLLYYNAPANCPSCSIPLGPTNDAPYEFVPLKAGRFDTFKQA